MKDNAVQVAVARLGGASRTDRPTDHRELDDARNNLLAVKLERAIKDALNPPKPYEALRVADRKRLAAILRDGDGELL